MADAPRVVKMGITKTHVLNRFPIGRSGYVFLFGIINYCMNERSWGPSDFRLQATSLWSFPERGSWATHDGGYRGNWSPYIPRNLMLRYTRPSDLVVDPFVGGGTTAIEAKLLGRRCLALDLTTHAVRRTRAKSAFAPPPPVGAVGIARADARCLPVRTGAADLVLVHPPYADIIRYSPNTPGDLSHLPVPAFLRELTAVASECRRITRPGGTCAVLMGDTRTRGRVVPLGMETLRVFQQAGFATIEVAIKAQHQTRTEAHWRPRAAAQNFLLLAHEYLFIFTTPSEAVRSQ